MSIVDASESDWISSFWASQVILRVVVEAELCGDAIAVAGWLLIIRRMRRLHVEKVIVGEMELGKREGHHARDVLRMGEGVEVEVFDDGGRVGVGVIVRCDGKGVVVRVERVREVEAGGLEWVIAAAVPKGTRGDWMVEKLAELGAGRFVPLAAERSVVRPEGRGKRGRWERLAQEAARQSKRVGVMRIDELREVGEVVGEIERRGMVGWYMSIEEGAERVGGVIEKLIARREGVRGLVVMVGPEGGWTERERERFKRAGLTGVRMGGTILRVETAAVAAAAIVAGMVVGELRH